MREKFLKQTFRVMWTIYVASKKWTNASFSWYTVTPWHTGRDSRRGKIKRGGLKGRKKRRGRGTKLYPPSENENRIVGLPYEGKSRHYARVSERCQRRRQRSALFHDGHQCTSSIIVPLTASPKPEPKRSPLSLSPSLSLDLDPHDRWLPWTFADIIVADEHKRTIIRKREREREMKTRIEQWYRRWCARFVESFFHGTTRRSTLKTIWNTVGGKFGRNSLTTANGFKVGETVVVHPRTRRNGKRMGRKERRLFSPSSVSLG